MLPCAVTAPAALGGGGRLPRLPRLHGAVRGGAEAADTADTARRRRRGSRPWWWLPMPVPLPSARGPARSGAPGERRRFGQAGGGWAVAIRLRRCGVSPPQVHAPMGGTWLLRGALCPEPAGQYLRGFPRSGLEDSLGLDPIPFPRGRKFVWCGGVGSRAVRTWAELVRRGSAAAP